MVHEKVFQTTDERNAWMDKNYPDRRCTDTPGLFETDGVYISVRHLEVNVETKVQKYPSWKATREFILAQKQFYDAAARLQLAWDAVGNEFFSQEYPFSECFEEVVANIGKWINAPSGIGNDK